MSTLHEKNERVKKIIIYPKEFTPLKIISCQILPIVMVWTLFRTMALFFPSLEDFFIGCLCQAQKLKLNCLKWPKRLKWPNRCQYSEY